MSLRPIKRRFSKFWIRRPTNQKTEDIGVQKVRKEGIKEISKISLRTLYTPIDIAMDTLEFTLAIYKTIAPKKYLKSRTLRKIDKFL
ncbi:MAG: hypothetical protein ACP6IQ_05505 [Candidatus Njordarchaeia archaeon]